MAYTITSDRLDVTKAQGEKIEEKELLAKGANIDALIAGGHLSTDAATPSAPAAPAAPVASEGAVTNG